MLIDQGLSLIKSGSRIFVHGEYDQINPYPFSFLIFLVWTHVSIDDYQYNGNIKIMYIILNLFEHRTHSNLFLTILSDSITKVDVSVLV